MTNKNFYEDIILVTNTVQQEEVGDVNAQHNLGKKYANGRGVPKSYIKAYSCYFLADEQWNKLAKSFQDAVAKKMTKEEIAEAQKRSSECFANDYKNCD